MLEIRASPDIRARRAVLDALWKEGEQRKAEKVTARRDSGNRMNREPARGSSRTRGGRDARAR